MAPHLENTKIPLAIRAALMGLRKLAWGGGKGCLMLIYHCPNTGRVVRSGIETSEAEVRRLSALRFSLWCPHCQTGHGILGKDTKIATDIVRSTA